MREPVICKTCKVCERKLTLFDFSLHRRKRTKCLEGLAPLLQKSVERYQEFLQRRDGLREGEWDGVALLKIFMEIVDHLIATEMNPVV